MGPTNRILLALAGGALLGLLLAWFDPALAERVADAVQPIGRLWLNALQMTVVPLVLALVVVGVNTASDAAALQFEPSSELSVSSPLAGSIPMRRVPL